MSYLMDNLCIESTDPVSMTGSRMFSSSVLRIKSLLCYFNADFLCLFFSCHGYVVPRTQHA